MWLNTLSIDVLKITLYSLEIKPFPNSNNGKSPGWDTIINDIIKYGEDTLLLSIMKKISILNGNNFCEYQLNKYNSDINYRNHTHTSTYFID